MKLLADISWYKDIKELINSKGFEYYNQYINQIIIDYKNSIVKIDPNKNKLIYTEHDINRKVLWILNDIKRTPLETLHSMRWTVQEDEDSSSKIVKVINELRKKLGI